MKPSNSKVGSVWMMRVVVEVGVPSSEPPICKCKLQRSLQNRHDRKESCNTGENETFIKSGRLGLLDWPLI